MAIVAAVAAVVVTSGQRGPTIWEISGRVFYIDRRRRRRLRLAGFLARFNFQLVLSDAPWDQTKQTKHASH